LESTESLAVSVRGDETPTDTDNENVNFQTVELNQSKFDRLERLLKDAIEKLVEVSKVKKAEPAQSVKMVNEVWTVDQDQKVHQAPLGSQETKVH
jgi:hypothetical protein